MGGALNWLAKLGPLGERTLCFPIQGSEVLLGLKKSGLGAGKYLGFGGKIEPGEGIEQATVRELHEECGLIAKVSDLRYAGRVVFLFPSRPAWSMAVSAFVITRWQGLPTESAEMQPIWFRQDAIPFDQMWADAPHWIPDALKGQVIQKWFVFNDDNATIQSIITG